MRSLTRKCHVTRTQNLTNGNFVRKFLDAEYIFRSSLRLWLNQLYSVSTNFRLELKEPSAKEGFIFLDSCREIRTEGGGQVRRELNWAKLIY